MTHTLTIPSFLPVSANVLLRLHPMNRGRQKKGDAAVVAHYFRESGIPRAIGKRRVSVLLTLPPRHGVPDADNICKVLLDALKACGAILDDRMTLCELGRFAWERGPRRMTIVELTDLEDEPCRPASA